jgi:hypothetical protein
MFGETSPDCSHPVSALKAAEENPVHQFCDFRTQEIGSPDEIGRLVRLARPGRVAS